MRVDSALAILVLPHPAGPMMMWRLGAVLVIFDEYGSAMFMTQAARIPDPVREVKALGEGGMMRLRSIYDRTHLLVMRWMFVEWHGSGLKSRRIATFLSNQWWRSAHKKIFDNLHYGK